MISIYLYVSENGCIQGVFRIQNIPHGNIAMHVGNIDSVSGVTLREMEFLIELISCLYDYMGISSIVI